MTHDSITVFGQPIDNVPLLNRPSAYAVIQDSIGRIAVVHTERGCYLPGGGIEPGETPEEACCREALEECGWKIHLTSRIGQAVDVFYLESLTLCYRIQATYFTAEIVEELPESLILRPHDEPPHTLLWLSPQEALPLFVRPGHQWAVEKRAGNKATSQ